MTSRFADTWFYIALLDRDDQHHQRVRRFISENDDIYVTTRWVLAEAANALGSTPLRRQVTILLNDLEQDASTVVIKPSDELYARGLQLFTTRPDKGWSLTDCISFVVMQEHRMTEALTADHHFQQAGFQAVFAS